jgi:hypothetical protein
LQTDANGNKSITDVTNGIGGAGANSTVGTMFFGTISGGAGAALTGGNFWQGAVTGLVVSGLNHAMHGGFAKRDSEVVVMLDKEGAHNQGHSAILGGNDKKGWYYASKEGRVGDATENPEGTHLTGGPSDARKTYYDTKAQALAANPRYETFMSIKTSYNTAMKAVNATYNSAKTYYHVLFNNCAHAVSDGLEAIGIYGGASFIPNIRFYQINNKRTFIK